MWGRVRGCAFLAAGCCAGMIGAPALAGVIVFPVAGAERSAPTSPRLDAESLTPRRPSWEIAPALIAVRVAPSLPLVTPWRPAALPLLVLQPVEVAASFPHGAPRASVGSSLPTSRQAAGVIPLPELPDREPFADDLFAARAQARSGIVEFFSVPAPSGVLAFTPLALLAARRRRAR